MNSPRAVAVHGYAGAFHLAVTQTGFDVVSEKHDGGFGIAAVEANRHLLTSNWYAQDLPWSPEERISFVFGNPACSGFSSLNTAQQRTGKVGAHRGIDSGINNCMHQLIDHAIASTGSDGKRGPEIVCFESVQQAYSIGRPLMQQFRDKLELETGHKYSLWHLLHNSASFGGAQMRPRYFFLVSRIPFGMLNLPNPRPQTYWDAIEDLANMPWDISGIVPYNRDPVSAYQIAVRGNAPGTDGLEVSLKPGTRPHRIAALLPYWEVGEGHKDVMKNVRDSGLKLPEWEGHDMDRLIEKGFQQVRMVQPNRVPHVITGGGNLEYVHWNGQRYLSCRELLRLMGFPDDWRAEAPGYPVWHWTGKQICVQCGEWVAQAAYDAIIGDPGPWIGTEIGDRERVINVTRDWQAHYDHKAGTFRDSRPKWLIETMAARANESTGAL